MCVIVTCSAGYMQIQPVVCIMKDDALALGHNAALRAVLHAAEPRVPLMRRRENILREQEPQDRVSGKFDCLQATSSVRCRSQPDRRIKSRSLLIIAFALLCQIDQAPSCICTLLHSQL